MGFAYLVDGDCENLSDDHRKKMALYSQLSLLSADSIEAPDWDRQEGDYSVGYCSGPDLGMCLSLAYRYKADVLSGILLPVPREVAIIDQESLVQYHELISRTGNVDLERVYETDVAKNTRIARLPEGVLKLQLEDVHNPNEVSLGVLLPSLERVTLEDVQKLRKDFGEEFTRFQKAILGFAHESELCDDPSRFREIAQRVEEEVRTLEKSIESIRRTHSRSLAAFTGSVVDLVYVLGVPNAEIGTAIAAVLSASSLSLLCLLPQTRSACPVEQSAFYFPLRVMDAARRKV